MQSGEWKVGFAGEIQLKNLFEREGFFVLHSSASNSQGAPGFRRNGEFASALDLCVARDGDTRWVEVKTKKLAPEYERVKGPRTGVDTHAFRHYLNVQKITGIPGDVYFLHLDEKKLYFASLARLEHALLDWETDEATGAYANRHRWKKMGRWYDRIFWDVTFLSEVRSEGVKFSSIKAKKPNVHYPWQKEGEPRPSSRRIPLLDPDGHDSL